MVPTLIIRLAIPVAIQVGIAVEILITIVVTGRFVIAVVKLVLPFSAISAPAFVSVKFCAAINAAFVHVVHNKQVL
jgi:hypothetical protein